MSNTERNQKWARKYGPWAVVTGASNGIGREMAREIARRGVNVVLAARRRPELEELGRELRDQFGMDALVFARDLADPSARQALMDVTSSLDVGLVVPAAGFGSGGLFEHSSLEREQEMIEVNITAVLDIVHGFVPRLIRRGRGGIILWSSITAFSGVPYSAHYAATKAWNQSLAEGLHLELKKHRIDVLSSAPATVNTGFADAAGLSAGGAGPESVARATVRALGRRMTVRPGFLATALDLSLKLPRALRARMLGMVMGGMVRDQRNGTRPRVVALRPGSPH